MTAIQASEALPQSTMTSVVAVVTTAQNPSERVIALVQGLAERGHEVQLFTTAPDFWLSLGLVPAPRVRRPERQERDHPVSRIERTLVYRIPKVFSRVGDLIAETAPQGWIGRLGAAAAGAQRRVSGVIHHRLFMPGYREFRPLIMAWVLHPQLRDLDLDRLDRIVAADVNSVPFASRLARRYPYALATNSLLLDTP